jgi:hypothetical protein
MTTGQETGEASVFVSNAAEFAVRLEDGESDIGVKFQVFVSKY